VKRLPTYIPGLDAQISGGPPEGSLVLVRGAPGTGKTVLVLQSLYSAALQGEPGIYFTFDETPQNLAWYSATFGWNIGALQQEKRFYIYYLSEAEYERFRPDRVDTLKQRLEYIIKSTGAKRVAIDSMTTISHYLINTLGISTDLQLRSAMLPVVKALNELAKSLNILLYVVIHPSDPAAPVYEALSDGIFDIIYYKDIGGITQRGLKITKLRSTKHPLDVLGVWIEKHGMEVESL